MEPELAWQIFEAWCLEHGAELRSARAETLAGFVADLRQGGETPLELRKLLEALARALRSRELEDLTKDPRVQGELAAAGAGALVPAASPELIVLERAATIDLPPVLSGHETPQVQAKVQGFYRSVAAMFEAWLARRTSENTRRAYRADIMNFVKFLGIRWPTVREPLPDESSRLLQATVPEVQAWRDYLNLEENAAPNTLNRRVSSLSGFYRFMREAAAEMRLPITVPNPAHSQFIRREVQEPVTPTEALSPTRARQLMSLPHGEGVLACRDRAILKFYVYSGARIGTGCRLKVEDFRDDSEDPKILIQEKGRGKSKRAVGINVIAADALREYLRVAGLTSGPLFRPRANSKNEKLADRALEVSTLYRLIQSYLERLPGALKERELEDGTKEQFCIFSPHSLRATTATILLDSGEDIRDVQKLLGHKHVTVTQVYDKRRRGTKDSASHRIVI
jgi:integrase/recombinase XerD